MANEELMLPVDEKEYEIAGSKFITFSMNGAVVPATDWKKYLGETNYKVVEVGMPSWDTPGKSVKFPVTIIEEGTDNGKEDKLSAGVDSKGVWKLKEIQMNLTGKDLEMKLGADKKKHPVIKPQEYVNVKAMGVWQIQKGNKGGDPNAEIVYYPKLVNLLPPNSKPETQSLL